jgi:FSR family fosmidomycin resistance protein-like MFS transporter
MTEPNRMNVKVIVALTLIHFSGDFYISFVNPLLPVFAEKFTLSLAQVGLIAGTMQILGFIVQPAVGYFSDRYRSRLFILGGPLLAMVAIGLTGLVPSYALLLLCVGLGAIGTAMFHPSVAGMVGAYAGRHFGLGISIFNVGGTIAFAVGPLTIAIAVARWGLAVTPWIALPGLAVMVWLFYNTPAPAGEGLRGEGFFRAVRAAFGETWTDLLLLWIVMVLRAFVTQAFLTFTPLLYAREGLSLVEIGLILSLFVTAGAIGGLFAGHLSDRIGYRPIFYACFGLSLPALLLMLFYGGAWLYVAALLAGTCMMSTIPLGLVMGQKLAPQGRSMVSSLMVGLAMGLGGMMAPLVGALADLFSIRAVLGVIALVPLASLILVRFFPEARLRDA